jgi:hypothetical protein
MRGVEDARQPEGLSAAVTRSDRMRIGSLGRLRTSWSRSARNDCHETDSRVVYEKAARSTWRFEGAASRR